MPILDFLEISVSAPVFEFDQFELDVAGYELRRAGRKVRLQRVPMDLLILLVERRGVLVSREEIASHIWNGDALLDAQSSINTAIRKIRQALEDDGDSPQFVETVVGKGYRFIGHASARVLPEQSAPGTPQASVPARRQRALLLVSGGLAGAVAVIALASTLSVFTHRETLPMSIVPFIAVPGLQSWPAFSPDGSQVAFGWTGETGNCSHIYVKRVDGASPVRLTSGTESDSSPSWSPDGHWLAFLRTQNDGQSGLYVLPAAGGSVRRISTVHGPSNYRPAWTPDGKAVVIMSSQPPEAPPSLFHVAIDSGEKRQITKAVPTGTGDWCPAYSPDGRLLAYLHNTGSRRLSPIYIVPVDEHGLTLGVSKRIETGSAGFTSFAWSADGRSFIATTPSGLVRAPLSGGAVEPLPFPDGGEPSVALRGNRMVYVRPVRDTDVFRVAGLGASGDATNLISSTREEFAARYSADGQRIVFVSDRSGSEEIWIADSQGRKQRPITSFGGPSVGSPRWSPDGKWVAFDSTVGGRAGIYIIASSGGAVQRITSANVSSVRPSWSHDGKWIYFGSDQSGQWEIWKTTPHAATPIQVTRNGGRETFEDPNGGFLYYTKTPPQKGIWRIPSSSGDEIKISDDGRQGRWAVGNRGIYFLKPPGQIMMQEFSTGRAVPVRPPGLQLAESSGGLISVAPDDRWILLTIFVRAEEHLTLVRNFK